MSSDMLLALTSVMGHVGRVVLEANRSTGFIKKSAARAVFGRCCGT